MFGCQKKYLFIQEIKISKWMFDSGCIRHMIGNLDLLTKVIMSSNLKKVRFTNNKECTIVGKGNVGNIKKQFIRNVYLVKGLKHNLISISPSWESGLIRLEPAIGFKVLIGIFFVPNPDSWVRGGFGLNPILVAPVEWMLFCVY